MLGRAATQVSPHDHVIAASAHYLTSPEPGPVTVTAEVLRAGRAASQIRAQLHQHERACVEALLTVSHLDPTTRPYWDAGAPSASHVAFDDALPLVPRLPNGDRVAIIEQVAHGTQLAGIRLGDR